MKSKLFLLKKNKVFFAGFFLLILFVLFFKSEDQSIKKARFVDLNIEVDKKNENSLCAFKGDLISNDPIGDLYLKKGDYIVLRRNVEMYSWSEKWGETLDNGVKFFSYEREWTKRPSNSSRFKERDSYVNPVKSLEDKVVYSKNVFLNDYKLDVSELEFFPYGRVELNKNDVVLLDNFILGDNYYLYKGTGSLDNPEIGDLRISYSAINNTINNLNIYGSVEVDKKMIIPYYSKKGGKIFVASFKDRND